MKRFVFVLAALAGLGGAALAQQTVAGKPMLNPNAPINLSSDKFVADLDGKAGTYTGNVIVRQGEVSMRSNTMRAQFEGNKPGRITAQGKIVLDSPSGIATGDNGIYDVNPRIVTLTGNVVLTREKNVMRGKQLVVNLVTGIAKLDGGGSDGKPGRVQAVFSNDNTATGAPKP